MVEAAGACTLLVAGAGAAVVVMAGAIACVSLEDSNTLLSLLYLEGLKQHVNKQAFHDFLVKFTVPACAMAMKAAKTKGIRRILILVSMKKV